MARDVRFIVLNGEEDCAGELRSALLRIPRVKIVAEVEEPALLGQAVKQFPVEAVLVNLDPVPDAVLPVVAEVVASGSHPSIFATSSSTDGHLILKAMRMGVKEFLPKPIEEKSRAEAVGKVAEQCVDTAH